jgi:hypothetical protein
LLNEYDREVKVNVSDAKIVSPQGIQLNGSGPAVFREQSSCFSVLVPMGFLKNWRERSDATAARVWLLRIDGTSVPQLDPPFVFSLGAPGDYATDYQFYRFVKVPRKELAAVVVSYHGKLYCHEIEKMTQS